MARFLFLPLLLTCLGTAAADSSPPELTLPQAVAFALEHHPSLRTRAAALAQSTARTEALRTGYAPQLELGIQLNRATGNVLPGSLFAMRGVPAISGPPLPARFDSGAFGSVASIAASWDAAGLVQRMAQVDAALLAERQTQATTEVRRLEVAYAAADSFLQLAALDAGVRAARANTERARTFASHVQARQKSELRPGADLSRANAELALAETQLVRAEQAAALARIQLAQALGVAGTPVATFPISVDTSPVGPIGGDSPSWSAAHPARAEADAAVAAARAETRAVTLQYLPRVEVAAALWVRGSGLYEQNHAQGLLPDTPNWAVGLVVSWPVLEMFGVRARVRAARAQTALQEAQREEVTQAIKSQIDAARTMLDAAMRVAQNTPVTLAAAHATEQQSQARYRAGLASVLDVAEAQRLLAQAETEDAMAHIAILRARLLLARALGDLAPFLTPLATAQGAR